MWTRALADADASCGGKAYGLARLIAAGLRVPDGFVLDDRAFRVATGDAVRTAQNHHPSASLSGVALRNAILEPDPGISLRMAAAPDEVGKTLDQLAHQIEHAELPADLTDEVLERARRLGGPFAVRSSATIEDGEAGAAAGVFSSRTVVPIDQLWSAIRAVWLSALTPLAAAYARRRGGETSINVIVQRSMAGIPLIAYTRPPGKPDADEIWIQRPGGLVRIGREPSGQRAAAVGGNDTSNLIAAERAIGASSGADLELVIPTQPGNAALATSLIGDPMRSGTPPVEDTQLPLADAWIVQARPIVHPVLPQLSPPPPMVLAPLDDGRTWTWDIAHNPDPLSPAQAGLVEAVERAKAAPWSSKICAGYLYSSPTSRQWPVRPTNPQELTSRVWEIEERMAHALGGVDSSREPAEWRARDLADAVDRYIAFFRIWATELGPLIAVSRGDQPALVGDRPSAVEATLLAAARGELVEAVVIQRLGVLAPAWDVAVPTFGEQPAILRDAIARARTATQRPPLTARLADQRRLTDPGGAELLEQTHDRAVGVRDGIEIDAPMSEFSGALRSASDSADRVEATRPEVDALALAAADLAEADDLWFARAQWLVRRAIQEKAAALEIEVSDAFWLPLDELVAAETIDPTDASRRASGARAAAARAAKWAMPIVVGPQEKSGVVAGTNGSPTSNPGVAVLNDSSPASSSGFSSAITSSSDVSSTSSGVGTTLRGIGIGGRATGRVRRFQSLASAIVVGRGDVIVTRAITPALAVIVVGCAAIVSETGGVLDHGAAMARELGIPCVVGCRDAWSRFAEGMIISIDGDAVTIDS